VNEEFKKKKIKKCKTINKASCNKRKPFTDRDIMENIAITVNEEERQYRRINEYKGRIYFDRKRKQFIQIRETLTNSEIVDGFVCGGFTDYYEDAKHNICFQRLTTKYIIENLIAVNLANSRQFIHDGIGWRVINREIRHKLNVE
jgi:hypothetical protein